jgi:hypothetical protein
MTDTELHLLSEFNHGIISKDVFLKRFPVDLENNPGYIIDEVKAAIDKGNEDGLEMVIPLIWLTGDCDKFVDLLNELLITPNHFSHQRIARTLQDIASPTTVEYVRKALKTGFDYLDYSGSETDVIAKWFSHVLYAIGTGEAIELIEEYCYSENEGISTEMIYRLSKIKE